MEGESRRKWAEVWASDVCLECGQEVFLGCMCGNGPPRVRLTRDMVASGREKMKTSGAMIAMDGATEMGGKGSGKVMFGGKTTGEAVKRGTREVTVQERTGTRGEATGRERSKELAVDSSSSREEDSRTQGMGSGVYTRKTDELGGLGSKS